MPAFPSSSSPQVPSPQEQSEAEEEDDDIPSSQPAPQQSAASEERPGPSGVGRLQSSQRQGSEARKRRQVDDAILTLVERASGTKRLQAQVDEALTANNNPRTAWANWMGTELQELPDHMWTLFQKESFALVMRFKEGAQAQPQPPQQPQLAPQVAPRPASVPLASTPTSFQQPQLAAQLPPRPASTPTSFQPLHPPQEWAQQPIVFQQQPPHPPQLPQAPQSSGLTPTQAPQPSGLTPFMGMSWSSSRAGQDLNLSQLLAYTQATSSETGTQIVRSTQVLQEEETQSQHSDQ